VTLAALVGLIDIPPLGIFGQYLGDRLFGAVQKEGLAAPPARARFGRQDAQRPHQHVVGEGMHRGDARPLAPAVQTRLALVAVFEQANAAYTRPTTLGPDAPADRRVETGIEMQTDRQIYARRQARSIG
jgi:hypothetical protein